jgi:hypothetical protein
MASTSVASISSVGKSRDSLDSSIRYGELPIYLTRNTPQLDATGIKGIRIQLMNGSVTFGTFFDAAAPRMHRLLAARCAAARLAHSHDIKPWNILPFSLERNGLRVYVEIVGFWTPEYLKYKIQKLNSLQGRERLILLVNRSLACTGSEVPGGESAVLRSEDSPPGDHQDSAEI